MNRTALYSALLIVTLLTGAAQADNWPQFLGAASDGSSTEVGLVNTIDGVSVAWRVPGGVGMSAVAVVDDIAVTMWNEGDDQVLVALDANSGEQRWKTGLCPQYQNGQGDGPRATPTIADGVVYALTGNGILCAAKASSGELIWKTSVLQAGDAPSEYGMSSSPLVVDNADTDLIVVNSGSSDGTITAFDTTTGDRKWSAGSGAAGYSTPALLEVDGQRQIVSLTGAGVTGIDLSGNILWTYPFKTPYDCNTAKPINIDGGVFISAGENHGCVLLDVKSDGSQHNVTERWASVDSKSVMRNEWQTSVVVDGNLYGFDNVGSAGPVTHLSCINATTGEPIWSKTRFGKSNLTLADGKLWITTMQGELVLVKASPAGYQELGRQQLFGKTRQSLSIANGHGYIRDNQEVICLKLK